MGDSAWPGTALPCSGRAAGLACARVCVRASGEVGGKVIPGGCPRPVARPCRAAPPPGAGRNRSDAGVAPRAGESYFRCCRNLSLMTISCSRKLSWVTNFCKVWYW